jgi:argininosuccinate lyase
VISKLVLYAVKHEKSFQKLSLDEYQKFSPLFAEDVYSITVDTAVAARKVVGGTAQEQVDAALAKARELLAVE